ncbi:thiamine diphosphokinase [Desulfobacterales bacterium HSG17]|nr:thiamine diphosphokinase [Desulfobacterales bacterium HSG17]
MRVIIFANGEFNGVSRELIKSGNYIIAADGGALHCIGMKIIPDVVIGDFDSLSSENIINLQESGADILRFPAKKDQTDLELALEHAVLQGAKEIIILGALGGRWDMTFSNVLLMAKLSYSDCLVRVIDEYNEIVLIKTGERIKLSGRKGDTLSLIPLAGDALGITTEGLEYPLDSDKLSFGSPRGVSNVMLGQKAGVHIKQGTLLCLLTHKANER